MSRSLSNATLTADMLERLRSTLMHNSDPDKVSFAQAKEDAESLRRISMTLHRWHELECGTDGGCIERGHLLKPHAFDSDENGRPYWVDHSGHITRYHKIPDREAGALKRLAAIMVRYPSLASYVQGDPRGCALYILRSGDIPQGADVAAYYTRGIAVHQ